MALNLESRFEAYCDELVKALSHGDRSQPARWYLKGLMLPGSSKERRADGGAGLPPRREVSASIDAPSGRRCRLER